MARENSPVDCFQPRTPEANAEGREGAIHRARPQGGGSGAVIFALGKSDGVEVLDLKFSPEYVLKSAQSTLRPAVEDAFALPGPEDFHTPSTCRELSWQSQPFGL